jgi:hypothetical protein
LHPAAFGLSSRLIVPRPTDDKGTDDVSGAALPAPPDGLLDDHDEHGEEALTSEDALLPGLPGLPDEPGPDAEGLPPPAVDELAGACVRFVKARYGIPLDYDPDTLSFLDQWLRDARGETEGKPEATDLAQAAAGAYFGEVVRRTFGAKWAADGDHRTWKLCLSNVYCAFNPIGMAREALLLEPAEGWHAHLELDPVDRSSIEARLAALPPAGDDEYYAPTTRYDVLCIVVDALRASMRARGLGDVHFALGDYR